MNIEEFRDYCLSMDGVMEKTPFGKFAPRFDSTLVFYVLDHMFCMVDMDDFTSVSFRSNDEEIARITERYSAVTPPGKQGDEVLAKRYYIDASGNEVHFEEMRPVNLKNKIDPNIKFK